MLEKILNNIRDSVLNSPNLNSHDALTDGLGMLYITDELDTFINVYIEEIQKESNVNRIAAAYMLKNDTEPINTLAENISNELVELWDEDLYNYYSE